jgi:hypothetical protein
VGRYNYGTAQSGLAPRAGADVAPALLRLPGRPAASCVGVEQLTMGGHLLAAAAWDQHGSPDLALAAALTALSGFRGAARAEDQCLAYAQLASFAFQRRGYRRVPRRVGTPSPAPSADALRAAGPAQRRAVSE